MTPKRDLQKRRLLVKALTHINGTVVAFDQAGIDNEGGSAVNVLLTSDGHRFSDDRGIVDGYLVHGTATLTEVLTFVRQKLGLPFLLN